MIRQTRIKMCGLTRTVDVCSACEAGADAIGLVFYPPSPRHLSLAQAAALSREVAVGIAKTTLFVNADAGFVREAISEVKPDVLQFHGEETASFCEQFGKPYLKAQRVQHSDQIIQAAADYPTAALLLDSFKAGTPGGTGTSFNWQLIPEAIRHRIFLAGGLNPGNVGSAIAQIRPYGVDVSGGIESVPGLKDRQKIFAFVEQVREADRLHNKINA